MLFDNFISVVQFCKVLLATVSTFRKHAQLVLCFDVVISDDMCNTDRKKILMLKKINLDHINQFVCILLYFLFSVVLEYMNQLIHILLLSTLL